MELTLENAMIAYGIGALLWTLILGATNTELTTDKLVGIILWPVPMTHFVGQVIRIILP